MFIPNRALRRIRRIRTIAKSSVAQDELRTRFVIIFHRDFGQVAPTGESVCANGFYRAGNGQGGDANALVGPAAHRHDKGVVANGLQAIGQNQVCNILQAGITKRAIADVLDPIRDSDRLQPRIVKGVVRDLVGNLFIPLYRRHIAQLHAGELIAVVEGILAHRRHTRKVKGGSVPVPLIGKDGVVVVIKRALANVIQSRGVFKHNCF